MAFPRSGMGLSSDIVSEILRRLDGTTLAVAGCSCSDFRAVAKQEWLWEEACCSLWPSTGGKDIKDFIYALGGFRKFYADSFPLINVCNHPSDNVDRQELGDPVSPSEFVSVVDIQYKNKAIYSKILWGIPLAGDTIPSSSSSICPFRISLPSYDSEGYEESHVESGMLLENMSLSWILINSRTKQAVNLSSWRALDAHRHCSSDGDFTIRFGSIVPAYEPFPLKLGVCNIVVKCRVDESHDGVKLQISGVSMQLEDMVGGAVNEREGLVILQRGVECLSRSKDYHQVIRRCHDLLDVQTDMMDENMGAQCRMDPLCILFFVALMALAYFFIL